MKKPESNKPDQNGAESQKQSQSDNQTQSSANSSSTQKQHTQSNKISEEKVIKLSENMTDNIITIKKVFKDNDTLITRTVENPFDPSVKFCLVYMDGMINSLLMDQNVIHPLLHFKPAKRAGDFVDVIATQVTLANSVDKTRESEKIIQAIVYGDCVLLIDGYDEALILNTKGFSTRSINEPEGERVLKGPREGFTESLMINLSMLHRKMRTPDLKMKFKTFGTRTKTQACICYLDGLADKEILAELEKRLEKFSIDGTLDVNYIAEMIKDSPYSPVKTLNNTERPDVVAARLLEGRIALLLDGTPVALTLPMLFAENFQSDDDYYLNYYFSSIGRLLRILAFFISTSIPAIYVALVTFHQEMLPTPLLISISMSRQGVPFPTVVEAVLMIITFEVLRESGSRMPSMMGQALSIVGSLVIGQAAVQAKIVSAPIIIIVAAAGIAGLMTVKLKGGIILLRFYFLICASVFGLYGYMLAVVSLLIHLYNLNSFGIPIMSNATANGLQDNKDLYIRAPWWAMKKRPKYITDNVVRLSTKDDSK